MGDININNLVLYIIGMECGAIGTTEITERDNLLYNNEMNIRNIIRLKQILLCTRIGVEEFLNVFSSLLHPSSLQQLIRTSCMVILLKVNVIFS